MNATHLATTKKHYVKDLNINAHISKFKEQLKTEQVYKIPFYGSW